MGVFTRLGTWFGGAMLVGALASACGGGGEVTSSTTGTGGSGGGSTSSTTTSSSSSSGTGGKGGSGGTGGMGTGGMGTGGMGTGGMAQQGPHGPQASQLVNGGDVVKSPGYKMVFTIGQPTQNQTKTSSPSYRMQGGLIGANGTLP